MEELVLALGILLFLSMLVLYLDYSVGS